MIESITITGIKYDVDSITKKYAFKKIGKLDRYLPRHARKSVTAEIKLEQVNRDHGNKYEAEVILNVPGSVITAKDSTMNMISAIDIVEAKIVTQIRKYKETTLNHVGKRGLLRRFKDIRNRRS